MNREAFDPDSVSRRDEYPDSPVIDFSVPLLKQGVKRVIY